MAGKYTPLENYLRGLSESRREVTLSFGQIERTLNDKLPPSAYQYRAWWANEKEGQHVHAHAWRDAGWLVDAVHLQENWVRFIRTR